MIVYRVKGEKNMIPLWEVVLQVMLVSLLLHSILNQIVLKYEKDGVFYV